MQEAAEVREEDPVVDGADRHAQHVHVGHELRHDHRRELRRQATRTKLTGNDVGVMRWERVEEEYAIAI